MKVDIHITLKAGVLDPQGRASKDALHHLGFTSVNSVRQGKLLELDVQDGTSKEDITKMCEALLANTVIESYTIHMPEMMAA